MYSERIDMTGKKYGRWTVLNYVRTIKGKIALWNCICSCGTRRIHYGQGLRDGTSKSCGCYNSDVLAQRNYRHGMAKTKVYKRWAGMIQRCENKNGKGYHNYGKRGINVCKAWKNFKNFYKDMGSPQSDQMLDRINNDKGYYPSNCRWTSRYQQNNNKRTNIRITKNGITLTLMQWCEKLHLDYMKTYVKFKINNDPNVIFNSTELQSP